MENNERRIFVLRNPIRLKVEYERAGTFCEDYSRNISGGGMFLHTTATIPTGTIFELKFKIPGVDEDLVLNAEVVRVIGKGEAEEKGTDAGLGLRFIYESDEDAKRIARFVEDLSASV